MLQTPTPALGILCAVHRPIFDAINRGRDADTVGAVTGMIAGKIYRTPKDQKFFINNKRLIELRITKLLRGAQ
jgi:ADP-ribosylglycohydrolase